MDTIMFVGHNYVCHETTTIHFYQLTITNNWIESIDQDILGDISFDKTTIYNCPYLQLIHWNTFGRQTNQKLNRKVKTNLLECIW